MAIKFNFTNPVHLAISSTAAMTTWASTGYSTDPKHLVAVATAAIAGSASHSTDSSSPNVTADSHIVTPYANNLED